MFKTIKNFFLGPSPKKFCSLCGKEFVEWEQETIQEGILMVRLWRGCPVYKDNFYKGIFDRDNTYSNHYAKWTIKSSTNLFDPYTGKKR